jgi:hypothetical protein
VGSHPRVWRASPLSATGPMSCAASCGRHQGLRRSTAFGASPVMTTFHSLVGPRRGSRGSLDRVATDRCAELLESGPGLRADQPATHVDVLGQGRPVVPEVVADLAGRPPVAASRSTADQRFAHASPIRTPVPSMNWTRSGRSGVTASAGATRVGIARRRLVFARGPATLRIECTQ